MNRRDFTRALIALAAAATRTAHSNEKLPTDALKLNTQRYTTQQVTVDGRVMQVRAYENVPTVAYPVEPEYQCLNLYIPETYFQGGTVGRFNARTAPIFLPNRIGGYMPAKPGTLAQPMNGPPGQPAPPGRASGASATAVALSRGYIVAAPGARGRTLQDSQKRWTGKAPAAIVDLKAAVRWLRYNAAVIPGNVERIISNGTSAGGALSALLGASGNHPLYESALSAIGAAPTRDDIYAVSAYCPITNLPHADEAYEWQFEGLREYRNVAISMLDFRVERKEMVAQLTDAQMQISSALRSDFVNYVNRLQLKDARGNLLTLNADGSGALLDHIVELLKHSANKALHAGSDLQNISYIKVENAQVSELNFRSHISTIGRMKGQPAFDGLSLETGENQLFGNQDKDRQHFTDFSSRNSTVAGATRVDDKTVQAMDAMLQVRDAKSTVAPHWRIRHGSADKDTSLAVPALLAAAARERSTTVDVAFPWARPHSGDYDLDELFAWIEAQL